MRILFGLVASLVLLGAGCDPTRVLSGLQSTTTSPATVVTAFTFDAIEQEGGGVHNWIASLVGQPKRVRLPVVSVYAFGCQTPTQYCVSTFTGGCYGPFITLRGKTEEIDALRNKCEKVCDLNGLDQGLDGACTPDFVASHCSVLFDVDGRISRVQKPDPAAVAEHCTSDEPVYEVIVDTVRGPLDTDRAEEFELREYR